MILHEKLVSDEMSILHDIVANCICESEFCHLPSSPNVSLVQEAGPMGISRSTEKNREPEGRQASSLEKWSRIPQGPGGTEVT